MKCNGYCMTGHSLKDTCSEPLEGSFFMFVGLEVDSSRGGTQGLAGGSGGCHTMFIGGRDRTRVVALPSTPTLLKRIYDFPATPADRP